VNIIPQETAGPLPEVERQRRLRLLRRGPERRRPSPKLRRGIYLLPSMFTLANMFCGYACVVYSMRGDYETAAPFIGIAIVLDMLDGRIARLTGTASAFGLEFDSLADVISFGIAPAIMTFAWGLSPLGRLGWAGCFLFLTGAAVRLARFNIQHVTDKRYFVGMPSPAAAAVPAATIFAFPAGPQNYYGALAALAVVMVPAFLMVSTIRFRSFKTFDLQARRPHQVLILVALALVLVTTHPRPVLMALAYVYLFSGLIGLAWTRFRRRGGSALAPADQHGDEAAEGDEPSAGAVPAEPTPVAPATDLTPSADARS
jgi:CDP-diacylglycerol---serine O-phosphatidyltransferase